MSDITPASKDIQSDGCDFIFRAMRDVTSSKSPEDIVAVIRQHIVLDADCVILIRENISPDGLITSRTIVDWDRDGLTHSEPLPDTIRHLIDDAPLVVPDIDTLSDAFLSVKPYAENVLQAASLIILPLSRHQHITGYLVLGMHKPHHYDDLQVRQLEMLAWHIGTVLENRELADVLGRKSAQATLANDLAHELSGINSLETLEGIIASKIGKFLPNSHISLALITPEDPDVEFVVVKGERMPTHVALGGTRLKQAISREEAILFEELGSWPDSSLWQSVGVATLIVAPLMSRDQLLGTLNVGKDAASVFAQDDIPLCEQAAAQIATALQTIRTTSRLQSSLEEITMLYNVSLATSAAQNANEIYTAIVGKIADISKADRITLYLAGPDPLRGVEYVDASAIWQQDQLSIPSSPPRYLPPQVPILTQFPQSHSTLIFNNIQTDSRLGIDLRSQYEKEGVHALMLIPLSTSTLWLGGLLLETQKRQAFSDEQARLCRSLADQAALALNAQLLLARTQQVVGYEQILLNITNHIHSAETIDDIQQVALSELSAVLGIPAERLAERGLDASFYPELSHDKQELLNNVSVQVSLASENAKLLEQVKKSAAREQLVSNMTSQLQRATDINDVLETTVRTLLSALDEYDIRVRLLSDTQNSAGSTRMSGSGSSDGSQHPPV
jgi:GAF domain-containing protein